MSCVCFFKEKTAYEMRISDWSSDVCSSDLQRLERHRQGDPVAEQVGYVERERDGGVLVDESQLRQGRRGGHGDGRRGLHRRRRMVDRLRSEEHTSALQTLMRIPYSAFCLKKKKHTSELQSLIRISYPLFSLTHQ